MIESARNGTGGVVSVGTPIAETPEGAVMIADLTHPAFGIALSTYDLNQFVSFTRDGIVSRSDWTAITGTALLTPGAAYYLSGPGALDAIGSQHVGLARSATELRVQIEQVLVLTGGVTGDLDGGFPDSVYGGVDPIDAGGP